MKQKIYVNGILVGEIEITGDVEKDLKLIRDYLTAKGIQREVTMAQAMYRQALSFCRAANHVYKQDLQKAPRNVPSMVPFVVNSAFS
ncbi:MAG: hypothetical protein O7E51_14740, partial [Acidobacteria bacterium]|nr:hypothetical protein [Acidobacteriota bacterium]